MKKLFLILILFLSFNMISLSEQVQTNSNTAENTKLITKTERNIIISISGNMISDIYKLKNIPVSISENGISFKNQKTGTEIIITGKIKIIKNPSDEEWNKYVEYHFDEEFCSSIK